MGLGGKPRKYNWKRGECPPPKMTTYILRLSAFGRLCGTCAFAEIEDAKAAAAKWSSRGEDYRTEIEVVEQERRLRV